MRSRRPWRFLLLLAASTALAAWPLRADDPKPTEYEVKAAFILNFAHFTEWPDSVAADTLRVCILGDDPFGPTFDAILGRATGVRPVAVERDPSLDVAGRCHILFVSLSEGHRVGEILERVGARPILTVSDVDSFAERGGIIGFVIRRSKIRFQINPAAADRAHLRLSAKLLRLAERVGPEAGP